MSDVFPNLFQRQQEGKQCIRTDKGKGGFGCLIFQGFGLISVFSSSLLSLFLVAGLKSPKHYSKLGEKHTTHYRFEGSHLFSLLKRTSGDLLPAYKFLPGEEISGTKKLFNLPEKAVTRGNG